MNQDMLREIVSVIEKSDMSRLDLISVVTRTVEVESANADFKKIHVKLTDSFNSDYKLSEVWPVGALLLFTVFDGYLENAYGLNEGESFRKHYDALPSNSLIEIIEKDCYRIFKLIRNSAQHKFSSIAMTSERLNITYSLNGNNCVLDISREALKCLYTIVLNIINGKIYGFQSGYYTLGHYEGIINTLYSNMRGGIKAFQDDIGSGLIGSNWRGCFDANHLRVSKRYIISNPVIVKEDDNCVVFKHIENDAPDDENDMLYGPSSDYIYNGYLLPQELGVIEKAASSDLKGCLIGSKISFRKKDMSDFWKLFDN